MLIVTTNVAFGKRSASCMEVEDFKEALSFLKRCTAIYFVVNNEQVNELNQRYHLDIDSVEPHHEKRILLHTDTTLMKNVKCVCNHPSGMLMVYTKNEHRLMNHHTQKMKFTISRIK